MLSKIKKLFNNSFFLCYNYNGENMKKENKTTEIEEIEKNKEIIKYISFLFVGLACGLILSIFLRGEKYTNTISSDKFSV